MKRSAHRPIFNPDIMRGAPRPANTPGEELIQFRIIEDFTAPGFIGNPTGIAPSGVYAAVAMSTRFTMVDITDPAAPAVAGSVASAQMLGPRCVVTQAGAYAFVAEFSQDRLMIFNIGTPSAPTVAGSVQSTQLDGAHCPALISSSYCAVTANNVDRLTVVDISTPSSPSVAGSVQDTVALNGAQGVAVLGSNAFVCAFSQNYFTVVDVSTPSAPTVTTSVDLATDSGGDVLEPDAIVLDGSIAWVAGAGSIAAIDISTPASPSLIGWFADSGVLSRARQIAKLGTYLAVPSNSHNAVHLFDISDPSSPTVAYSVSDATALGNALHLARVNGVLAVCSDVLDGVATVGFA